MSATNEVQTLRFEISHITNVLNDHASVLKKVHDSSPHVDQIYLTVLTEMHGRAHEIAKGACIMLETGYWIPLGIRACPELS